MKVKEILRFISNGCYYMITFECNISKNASIRRHVVYKKTFRELNENDFEQKFLLDCEVKEIATASYSHYGTIVEFKLASTITYHIGVENA